MTGVQLLQPQAPRANDISQEINAFVDEAFSRKRANEPARDYVGASGIGNECSRAIQLAFAKVPVDPGRMTGKTLRIFETGHVFEAAVGDWLKMAGFELDIVDPSTAKQFGWSVLDDDGEGHVDGILRVGPHRALAYPALWECKALNEKNWQAVKKHGLYLAKPVYMGQFAINQAYLELHENPGLFTALNKNTSELYHELVPFDQKLAQQMSDKLVQIVQATESKTLLPRAYASQDNFKCRFCDYAKTCWEKLK